MISYQPWGLWVATLSSTCSLTLSCLTTDMLTVPLMISTAELSGLALLLLQQ